MSRLLQLPVLSLHNIVLFPGTTVTVRAPAAGVAGVTGEAMKHDQRVFVVGQREVHDPVTPEQLHTIGTIARIAQTQQHGGAVQLVLQGQRRGMAVRYAQREAYLEATLREIETVAPLDPAEPAFVAMRQEVFERSLELAQKRGISRRAAQEGLDVGDDAGLLADRIASVLPIDGADRQVLLETLSVEERLRRVLLHVQRQISVTDAQHDIQEQVQKELGERQREMALREQMKAIQRELGETDPNEDMEELRTRLEALDLPPEVRKEVDRDLGRLGRMGRESMDHQVLRTYLETVVELPWSERSESTLDLERAARILDDEHYGLQDVKDRVLEYLAVLQLQAGAEAPEEKSKGPILLFVGPPGVGKTSIGKSIAHALGREYVRMALGGVRDEADIRGHRRTYVGAMPGRIIQAMRRAGTKNPVVLLDEVDKLSTSFQGDPASALLEVLDPAQNHSFVDHYLGVPFDLSEVLFVATANYLQSIPAPLLDRLEKVEFSGYTEDEKLQIARRYLLGRQRAQSGLREEQFQLDDDALVRVIGQYTRESGVRQLERQLGTLARKAARIVAEGTETCVRVDESRVPELLGRRKVRPERAAEVDRIGVATGMYYTPVGGDIMFVEATTMPGSGKLTLTGQLGDVMKESAQAAWSYARAHAAELAIDSEHFKGDVHVHAPAGSIPKEGPSAGVTLTTALVSALSGVPVRRDIAMTGEITLTGQVLPIGGVKEKVLGAVRAGISHIVLPRDNDADLDDVPAEVRDTLTVHLVDRLDEVLWLALRRDGPDPVGEESIERAA